MRSAALRSSDGEPALRCSRTPWLSSDNGPGLFVIEDAGGTGTITVMDLSGVAAAFALLSIPASVLIARWQMRTALAQSEANHRAAMEVAEANHRAALEIVDANHQKANEAAEANHRRALELAVEGHRSAIEVASQ